MVGRFSPGEQDSTVALVDSARQSKSSFSFPRDGFCIQAEGLAPSFLVAVVAFTASAFKPHLGNGFSFGLAQFLRFASLQRFGSKHLLPDQMALKECERPGSPFR